MLDTVSYESGLKTDGYVEIVRTRYEPRLANGEHGHHFSVRGLIVILEGVERTYRDGETCGVAAGRMHFAAVGREGVEVLVGRKY